MSDLGYPAPSASPDPSPSATGGVTVYETWDDDDVEETKVFFHTSEFWLAILGVAAALIAAYTIDDDSISREDGWRFATALLVAYIISRGLAKAGTLHHRQH